MPTDLNPLQRPLTLSDAARMVGGTLVGTRDAARPLLRVVTHSAEVKRGDLFVALDGHTSHGYEHYREAISREAAAILISDDDPRPTEFPVIICRDKRKCGAEIANLMLGDPLSKLRIIGITGTKGKSSTLAMLAALFEYMGEHPLCVGTLGIGAEGRLEPTVNTTPDLFFLLPHFARYVQNDERTVLCEVSSQALADRRLDGIKIPLAIFTGFSRDHIGSHEHQNLSEYYRAKRRLFTDFSVCTSIAPLESPYSFSMTRGVDRRLFASLDTPSDLCLSPTQLTLCATRFLYRRQSYCLSVAGRTQLANATLAVLAASELLTVPPERLLPALSSVRIPGRMECYRLGDVTYIIDYAHNGESLRSVCRAARPFCRGRMIVLFGSVGGRGECRRRDLVSAAEEEADLILLTEDDTDGEEREHILSQMLAYAHRRECFISVPDRTEAIMTAHSLARAGDTVLLLGKGHEQFLVRDGVRIPFSEREILLSLGAQPLFS